MPHQLYSAGFRTGRKYASRGRIHRVPTHCSVAQRNMMVVSIQEKIAKKGRTSAEKCPWPNQVIFYAQLATWSIAGVGPWCNRFKPLATIGPIKLMRT